MRRIIVALFFMPLLALASVTSQVDKTGPFLITGLPQVIPVGFPFQQASDISVLDMGSTSTPRDPATTLILGGDYTVTGGGYNSQNQMQVGSVSVVSTGLGAVAVNDELVILRNLPFNQTTSLIATGPLTITQIEQALDKQATLSQELNELASRSLHFENFEFLSGNLPLSGRANSYLTFNSSGAVTFTPNPTTVVVVTGLTVPAISGLRALPVTGLTTGTPVSVQGYYTQGDAAGPRVYTYNSTSTATDDGGAVIQPNSGVGRWLLNMTLQASIKPAIEWWGAWGDNLHDDTTAFANAFAWLQSQGGGTLTFATGSTYLVNPLVNTNWISLTTIPVNLAFNGCTIHVGTSFTALSGQFVVMFIFGGCSPIHIGTVNITSQQMGQNDQTGIYSFDFAQNGTTGCSNVFCEPIYQTGGAACVQVYRGASVELVSSRSSNMVFEGINTNDVYYPFELQHSGDNVTANISCNTAFRPFFVFGVKHVKLRVLDVNRNGSGVIGVWNELNPAGTFLTGSSYTITVVGNTNWAAIGGSGSPAIGQVFTATGAGSGTGVARLTGGWADDPYTSDIDVEYTCLPRTTNPVTQGMNILFEVIGPSPCFVDNIKIKETIYNGTTYHEGVLLAFAKYNDDSIADETGSRGHILQNIDFSASVYNAVNSQADLFSFFDQGSGVGNIGLWTGETINNLHIHDVSVQGNSGNTMNIYSSPIFGEVMENVQFPGTLVQTGSPNTTGFRIDTSTFNGVPFGALDVVSGVPYFGTEIEAGGGIQVTGGGGGGDGSITKGGLTGLDIVAVTGGTNDFEIDGPGQAYAVAAVPRGTNTWEFAGPSVQQMTVIPYLATMSVNVALGNIFETTTINATGNATFNASAVPPGGQHVEIIIINDATSGKTMTFGTHFKSAGTLTGVTSKTSTIIFISDGTNLYEESRITGTL